MRRSSIRVQGTIRSPSRSRVGAHDGRCRRSHRHPSRSASVALAQHQIRAYGKAPTLERAACSHRLMRIRVLIILLSLSLLALSNTAAAQPADAITAGYQQLYAGDADEALRQFEALHARDRQQLPAWFGQLMTAFARLRADDSG